MSEFWHPSDNGMIAMDELFVGEMHQSRPGTVEKEPLKIIHTEDIFNAPAIARSPQRLFDPQIVINRPDMNYERRFAQTPLSPLRLYARMQPYPRILEMLLDSRLDETFEKTRLTSPYIDAIREEVMIGFDRRYAGNGRAYERLRRSVFEEMQASTEDIPAKLLSCQDANLIWRALTAGASMYDTAQLLLRYPAMNSIEAAKYTQPLDATAPIAMEEHIRAGLEECAQSDVYALEEYNGNKVKQNNRFIDTFHGLRIEPGEIVTDEERKKREHTIARRSLIIATKDNIASMTDGETVVELVRKQSFVAIDPELALPFTKPNVVPIKLGPSGERCTANVQPIATSCYWRVLPAAHPE